MFAAGAIDAARPESATESHIFQVFSTDKEHRLVVDLNLSNAAGKAPRFYFDVPAGACFGEKI